MQFAAEGTATAPLVLHFDTQGRLTRPATQTVTRVPEAMPVVFAGQGAALTRAVARSYAGAEAVRALGLSPADWSAFFAAMVHVESGFQQSAVSPAGAIGLAQLMPDTARALGVNPRDPVANLDGGARYLLAQIHRFGSLELGLAAYNAGPEAVARYRGIPPFAETRAHVRKVMAEYHRLSSSL